MITCERDRTNLQKMQRKTARNTLQYGECLCLLHCKHLYSWRRITQKIGIPSRTQKISQWNKCSTYLRNEWQNKMRSMKWRQLIGKILHGCICLWLVMNKSSVFSAQRSTSFQILCCVGKIHQNPESNEAWKKRIEWITSSQSYRDFHGINGEPTKFEWNIFAGFDTSQLCDKVESLLSRLGETPQNFMSSTR